MMNLKDLAWSLTSGDGDNDRNGMVMVTMVIDGNSDGNDGDDSDGDMAVVMMGRVVIEMMVMMGMGVMKMGMMVMTVKW